MKVWAWPVEVVTNARKTAKKNARPSIGFVNKFRNGTFDVWQRGTSPPVSTSGAYTADGWKIYFSGTAPSAAQSNGPGDGAPTLYGLGISGASGNTDVKLGQRIESSVVAPLAGQRVTFQIEIFNPSGVAVTPQLSTCYASATDNFSSCVSDLAATSLQSCNPATLCTLAYTFNASTNASKGYEVDIDLGAIAAGTGFRVYAADVRGTPGVPTGLNGTPPAPELRPIAVELLFCQRYLPAFNPASVGGAIAMGQAAGPTIASIVFPFPVPARAAPFGLTISSMSHFELLSPSSTLLTLTGFSLNTATTVSGQANLTVSSGLAAGNATELYEVNPAASIIFTGAEL